jgi:hypothetical protein
MRAGTTIIETYLGPDYTVRELMDHRPRNGNPVTAKRALNTAGYGVVRRLSRGATGEHLRRGSTGVPRLSASTTVGRLQLGIAADWHRL